MIGGDAGFTTDKAQGAYASVIGAGVHTALPANFNFGDQFTVFTYAKMDDNAQIQTIIANQSFWRKLIGLCAVRQRLQ